MRVRKNSKSCRCARSPRASFTGTRNIRTWCWKVIGIDPSVDGGQVMTLRKILYGRQEGAEIRFEPVVVFYQLIG